MFGGLQSASDFDFGTASILAYAVLFWVVVIWFSVRRWRRGEWIAVPLLFIPFYWLWSHLHIALVWCCFLFRERQIARRRKSVAEFIAAANLVSPGTKRIEKRLTLPWRRG